MQELEKILEEIDKIKVGPDTECRSECDLYDWSCGACVGKCDEYIKERVKNIIRKHMNDGWILAKDQLPQIDDSSEYYDSVEVTMRNGTVTHGCFRNDEGSWWIVTIDGSYRRALYDEIIAWRPLPNPYRPERSDNHDGE